MALQLIETDWIGDNIKEDIAFESVKVAFTSLGHGTITQPPIAQLQFPEHKGETCIKSAHLHGRAVACIKVASGFYDNPKKGLPSGSGLMLLLDATNGLPVALLRDGGYLTDLRTGAAGALCADLFCLQGKTLNKIAIIGSGCQARYQLRAISKVRRFSSVSAYSTNKENLAKYCNEMIGEFKTVTVTAADSVQACVTDADLIITTTPSNIPLVKAAWVKKGCTIVAVGSDTPGKQELGVDVLQLAKKWKDNL